MTEQGDAAHGATSLEKQTAVAPFDALVEAVRANEIELAKLFSKHTGGAHGESDGIFWAKSSVIHYSGVLSTRLDGERALEMIDQMKASYAPYPLPWWVWNTDGPPNLVELLYESGFQLLATSPAMSIDVQTQMADVPLAPTITVQRVQDQTMFATTCDIRTRGTHLPPIVLPYMDQAFDAIGFDEPKLVQHYLALHDGSPAGTATVFYGGGVAGIHNVATVPEKRGTGVATALIGNILDDIRSSEYTLAVLLATDMGFPLYKRFGFEVCGSVDICAYGYNL